MFYIHLNIHPLVVLFVLAASVAYVLVRKFNSNRGAK